MSNIIPNKMGSVGRNKPMAPPTYSSMLTDKGVKKIKIKKRRSNLKKAKYMTTKTNGRMFKMG